MGQEPSSATYLSKDWPELKHAYGSAEDVPALLADLNSPDQEVRQNAVSELFGNIWHQGTVYPATVKAIPELLALFKSPACADRDSIACLLASIADGDGFFRVHSKLSNLVGDYEKILGAKGSTIAEEIAKETDYVTVIRAMALDFLPLLDSFLDSDIPSLREVIVSVMKRYAKDFPHYQGRLSDRLAVETDEDVRDLIQEALVELRGNQN